MSVADIPPLASDGQAYESQVPGAAEWLDRTYGRQWATKVDVDNLHMDDSSMCIGGYLGIYWTELRDGYVRDTGQPGYGLFADYDEAWREEVLARQ